MVRPDNALRSRSRPLYPRIVTVIRPVILSGGSGTRLWPLSTPERPKQFSGLFGEDSLFGQTLLRLDARTDVASPLAVTGATHIDMVLEASRSTGVGLEVVLAEPEGRNTAPACIAAALATSSDDVLVILPSDHLIRDVEGFAEAVYRAVDQAIEGKIVTFGIKPTGPETGYGYIEMGPASNGARLVARFKEKPEFEEAQRLVADGNHVWNSGMFVVTAGLLLDEARIYRPDILDAVRSSMEEPTDGVIRLGDAFRDATRISLDHAIMEATDRAVVIPIDVGWDDIGSFAALWEVSEKDSQGNAVSGDVTLVDVANSYVRATSRTVGVAGVSDVVVVETKDAVLVVPRDKAQLVRDLVERLR